MSLFHSSLLFMSLSLTVNDAVREGSISVSVEPEKSLTLTFTEHGSGFVTAKIDDWGEVNEVRFFAWGPGATTLAYLDPSATWVYGDGALVNLVAQK